MKNKFSYSFSFAVFSIQIQQGVTLQLKKQIIVYIPSFKHASKNHASVSSHGILTEPNIPSTRMLSLRDLSSWIPMKFLNLLSLLSNSIFSALSFSCSLFIFSCSRFSCSSFLSWYVCRFLALMWFSSSTCSSFIVF